MFPPYALGNGLLHLSLNQMYGEVMATLNGGTDGDHQFDPFSWDVIGLNLCFLAAETVFFFTLNLAIESRVVKRWYVGFH